VTNAVWATTLAAPCSPSSNTSTPPSCDITKTVCSDAVPAPSDLPATCDSYTSLAANAHYFSITIQTPAKTSNLSLPAPTDIHTDLHYFEVTITQDTQSYVAGAIGKPTTTQGSRSTAYHFAPNQPFGFALFAKTIVGTQNKSTLVVGDVYADRNVDPQSSGQAGFCAAGGLIVLGAPQDGLPAGPPPPDGQAEVLPKSASPINYDPNACTATSNPTAAGTVNQTRNPQAGCTVGGTAIPAVYDSNPNVLACVANPSLLNNLPKVTPPTKPDANSNFGCVTATATSPASPGYYNCPNGTALTLASNNAQLNPGVYFVTHNPNCNPKSCYDVDISANTSLTGVTFWLDQGATLGVHGNGTTVSINPYPSSAQGPGDGRYPIYAPTGSVAQVWVTDSSASLSLYGTLYLPDGVAHTYSNAYYQIHGQAIVGAWDDQGGNHPTADITYDAPRNAPQDEVLKLVE
jgi:hypothetical protein